ncbi:MAG: hypothetical protein GEU93_12000 [Propionibacteriales bacterium]|nr:hypothetical protein [Propionibacteriales bacterium]
MQSSNPIFQRSGGFNGRAPAQPGGYPTYPGAGPSQGYAEPGHSDPSTWQTGGPVDVRERMTIDSVVQKTGLTMVILVAAAAVTWILLPDPTREIQPAITAWMAGAFGGLGLSLVLSFKRVISPALVAVFAAVEGVFVGAMSMVFETMWPGVVMQAVFGTFVAFAATLAAYKFFNITVSPKFRKVVVISMFGFVGLMLFEFALSLFGAEIGFGGFGTLGLLTACAGLVIGVLMLVLDFDFVERGIEAGLPEVESWRAAFGLTVTMVWIYINLLRILAILRGE